VSLRWQEDLALPMEAEPRMEQAWRIVLEVEIEENQVALFGMVYHHTFCSSLENPPPELAVLRMAGHQRHGGKSPDILLDGEVVRKDSASELVMLRIRCQNHGGKSLEVQLEGEVHSPEVVKEEDTAPRTKEFDTLADFGEPSRAVNQPMCIHMASSP
jgi:hypothetical protein